MWVEDKVMFLPLLYSMLFKCPQYYFHPVTEEMYKYLAVVCCSVLLGWQQVALLAADRSCETVQRVGMAALHTQRSWLNKAHLAHLILLKAWHLER